MVLAGVVIIVQLLGGYLPQAMAALPEPRPAILLIAWFEHQS
jgi:hypothetical protein